jgi:hypothetical protein
MKRKNSIKEAALDAKSQLEQQVIASKIQNSDQPGVETRLEIYTIEWLAIGIDSAEEAYLKAIVLYDPKIINTDLQYNVVFALNVIEFPHETLIYDEIDDLILDSHEKRYTKFSHKCPITWVDNTKVSVWDETRAPEWRELIDKFLIPHFYASALS